MHFTAGIREHFPFIIELFKTEKFFKETGYKPESVDVPADFVRVKTKKLDVNIGSFKKEFGENGHALLAARTLFEKEGMKGIN